MFMYINFSLRNKLRKCLALHFALEQDFGKITHFIVMTHFEIEIKTYERCLMVMIPKCKFINIT